MSAKPKALVIMGPTASGKTALSVEIAKAVGGEIISVDSAMVYRGMDIGTAKPTLAEQEGVVHHLMDICDPTDAYSAGRFLSDASACIDDVLSRGKRPILVGGTMLYHYVLQYGVADMPEADAKIREKLNAQAKLHGWQFMHDELTQIDPVSAQRIHPNDSQRIQRALEVFHITGISLHDWHAKASNCYKKQLSCDFFNVALRPEPRAMLHDKIAQRFHQMIDQGFIDEVAALFKRDDIHPDLPAMRSVGYRQVWQYLQGEYDQATMIEKGIVATRQLAKRQYTWLNKWSKAHFVTGCEPNLCDNILLKL